MKESDMVDYFLLALEPTYYGHLVSAVGKSFNEVKLIDTNRIEDQAPEAPNINRNPMSAHQEANMIEIVHAEGEPKKPSQTVMMIRSSGVKTDEQSVGEKSVLKSSKKSVGPSVVVEKGSLSKVATKQEVEKVIVPGVASKPDIIVEGSLIDRVIIKPEERLKETPIEPATVVLNDEKEANNEEDSLQLDAQPGELQNLPAEEVQGLQRLILDKQELSSEQDQLLAERNQLVKCFPVLKAKVANMNELKSWLQQTEQDKMSHIQEDAQLHEGLKEAKCKWIELHDAVAAVIERESSFEDQVNNLKANLCSKIDEVNAAKEMSAKMEDRLKRVMEQNRLHTTSNVELDYILKAMKAENEELHAKIDKLRAKLQNQEDPLFSRKPTPCII
ncbi:uncharacterized protein [Nicotiana sylvestris]|uniref:uncharacterized protein n=1 Tax=Nicotiana sylvestris TaxID=4096 RepID=UPI00388C45A7